MSRINKTLEQKANEILVKNDMLKIPVNLLKIADNHQIEVYYRDLPNSTSGAIRFNHTKNRFQILIQKSDSERRQRFTLAHELGHFFLHNEMLKGDGAIHVDYLYRSNNMDEDKEREVDYFAGALLMDKNLLETLYEINPSIRELAETFEVSESAMTVRLTVLGLI